jgi:iron complex transport system ATP-binding protein
MSALFLADRVTLSFDGRDLVRDACLALHTGQVTVVVGPNGAGKSSLLKLVTGEIKPSRGRVSCEIAPLGSIPPWRLAARRSVMAQSSQLAFPFQVFDLVALALDGIGRRRSATEAREIVATALRAADMAAFAGRAYQTLSGGERQRVQFARAIAQLLAGRSTEDRQALFLDEPIANLDPKHQISILERAWSVARGEVTGRPVAVLAVLHDLSLAAAYADRVVVMSGGTVVADGSPADVLKRDLIARVFEVQVLVDLDAETGIPRITPALVRPRRTAA